MMASEAIYPIRAFHLMFYFTGAVECVRHVLVNKQPAVGWVTKALEGPVLSESVI